MYKVTRIYMGNVGHVLAWYPGIDVPLTDVQTNEPTHTIYNLINQGGKSTFLSMFFTLFDPERNRFLQHLRNNAQKFEHYFDKDGQPGLIAVEWKLPGDLLSERRLVTGLIVVMKRSGELFEPDRFFFAFESAPGLSYNELPAEQLAGGTRVLESREDVLRWLQQMETRHAGNFQRFSNQNEWRACLEGRGIDVEMLRRQVEFNRTEGGMGEAFLDFKTEFDFVRKFMTLTLNPETAEQTHQTISTLCTRMKGRSKLVEAQQQLERFSALFDPFANAAGDFHDAQATRSIIEEAIARAYATFSHHASTHRRSASTAQKNALEFQAAARKAGGLRVEYAGLSEAYKDVLRKRLKATAEVREAKAKAASQRLVREEKILNAAALRSRIREIDVQVEALQTAIDLATRNELAPLRERRAQLATLLDHLLAEDIKLYSEQVAQLETYAKDLNTQRETIHVRKADVGRLRDKAMTELSRVRSLLEGARAAFARLVDAGTIRDFETAHDALARLNEAQDETRARSEDLEQQGNEIREILIDLNTRRERRSADVLVNGQKISTLLEKISKGDDECERLAHSPILCRAAGAEIANVDSEALPLRLREFIHAAHDQLATAQLKFARLQEDQQSIVDTQLAGRDPDVSAVVQFLANAALKGVRAFPQYLAEVLPDATAARRTVLSHPARFLGVTVPADSVERARAALEGAPLKLIRPVVVSAYAVDAAHSEHSLFTVPCGDDSAFNHAAARQRAHTLAAEIETASRAQREALKHYDDSVALERQLSAYRLAYGNGKLGALKKEEAHLIESNESLKTEVEGLVAQIGAMNVRQTELAGQMREAQTQLHKSGAHLKSVQDYIAVHEVHIPAWEVTRTQAETDIEAYNAELEEFQILLEHIETERQAGWNKTAEAKGHISLCAETRQNLEKHVDPQCDSAAELAANPKSYKALEGEFGDACSAVDSAERLTTAPLKIQLEAKERETRNLETEYARRYPESEYPVAEVAVFLDKDIEVLLEGLPERQNTARTEEAVAVNQAAHERSEYSSFTRQRAYPAVAVNVSEDVDNKTLGDTWLDYHEQAGQQQSVEHEAQVMASESLSEADRYVRLADDFDNQCAYLEALEVDVSEGLAAPDALTDIKEARNFSREQESSLRRTRARANSARERCGNLHEEIVALAREDKFACVDVELAMILRENSVDATINDYQRLRRAAENRRDTIENELASMAGDLARGTDALLALTADGLRILARAADVLKLPATLPVYGGKSVIKMSGTVHRLTSDQRREALAIYMEELCSDGNIPESGAALTAACIHRLAPNRRLDLRVLKLVSLESQQYVPVDGLSNSGAEKISMALFLYFIIAKLRYEQRADSKASEGGVLVLDNPFSTATARSIWETILALADSMKVQLVLVTGIKEYDVLSVFKRFVRLTRIGHNTTKERVHVGIVDYQFKSLLDDGAVDA